ncbi:hypothetical protein TVNIR_2069 [Thioalkalivibrio nitratireducens DSM 14787]|uniref:Uncharacterized protein n=1 Tax=Thioalkalivibrio nitratireducens (strain DSM 14787 / UNIQEM 213 / ALEN2) TaxID=1255043 RepID=L0DVV3_THIND|nr:hypothetical protein TVNIR_2069 [Thioalkalivibrio nitratireducens DSM 14787]
MRVDIGIQLGPCNGRPCEQSQEKESDQGHAGRSFVLRFTILAFRG